MEKKRGESRRCCVCMADCTEIEERRKRGEKEMKTWMALVLSINSVCIGGGIEKEIDGISVCLSLCPSFVSSSTAERRYLRWM